MALMARIVPVLVLAFVIEGVVGCVSNNGQGWDQTTGMKPVGPRPAPPRPGIIPSKPDLSSTFSLSETFNLIDNNNDGLVSSEEWEALFTQLVRNYDTNGDGMLSLAELRPSTAPTTDRPIPNRPTPARRFPDIYIPRKPIPGGRGLPYERLRHPY
ncbi:uncharacterized protein [Diadema setosum]|uniref:uncharacterized protein n=1 Tax=Diadema setosum TaxID=31175 RepID=UPI003B3AACF4